MGASPVPPACTCATISRRMRGSQNFTRCERTLSAAVFPRFGVEEGSDVVGHRDEAPYIHR